MGSIYRASLEPTRISPVLNGVDDVLAHRS